jgi:hypothetical protein
LTGTGPRACTRTSPSTNPRVLGVSRILPMHIKLSASRKLLWHYRVTTPTIMLASKELPYDDHTTGGPCYA